MKRIYSLLLTAMIAVAASAQVTFNAKAGIGLSSCIGGSDKVSSHIVGKAGFGIEYPLSSNFSFMPSLEFAAKGTKFSYDFPNYDGTFDTNETNITAYYVQVPILFAYRFNVSNRLNMVVKAGPYLACGVFGSITWISNSSYGSSSQTFDTVFDMAKRFECGVDVGVDFELKKFVVGVEYEIGITPFIDDVETLRNQAFYATVGYKF